MSGQQQQQQGGADNSLDFLWICALLVVGLGALWYFGHDYITMGVFYIRLGEIALINYTFEGVSYLLSLVGIKVALGPVLEGWVRYIQTSSVEEVSFQELMVLSDAVGTYIRYPIALVLLGFAWWIFAHHVNLRFNNIFDMKKLRSFEAQNWPQVTPVANEDLIEMDIDKGPWAMTLTPIQFGKKHGILETTTISGQSRASTNEGAARRVFAIQLGPLWKGARRLPIHARALFAAFAAKANRDGEACLRLLHQISRSSAHERLDYTGTDELLNKYENTKLVRRAVQRHAYVLTVMCSMLDLARTDGVLSCSEFLWLKPVDRRLWYVLNSVGRQTAVPEAAGPYSHWLAEMALGRPLKVPMVDQAATAYQVALEGILYDPEEDDDEASS